MAPIDDLAIWVRNFAASAQAPAGQPNEVGDNLTEIAMFLDQCVDHRDAIALGAMVRSGAADVNEVLKARCATRRADVVSCSANGVKTDGAKIKCSDCPKRAGLSVTTRNLA